MQGRGVRIPEEVSAIGFDDMPVSRLVSPKLSTVRQNPEARAEAAMEALQKLRSHEEMPSEIMLPVEPVLRESTAGLSGAP